MSEAAKHAGQPTSSGAEIDEQTRRDFLIWSTVAVGAAGTALAVWPFIDQMNPAADTLALASTEVDISQIAVGQSITVIWRGKPVFIRHRTAGRNQALPKPLISAYCRTRKAMPRVSRSPSGWLWSASARTLAAFRSVRNRANLPVISVVGSVPATDRHYDTSGRIRKGPAPTNLTVPTYQLCH